MNLSKFFVDDKRDNGESFVKTTDDRPEWLQDAIREAHCSDLPNDWIYETSRAVCGAIDDGALTDDDSLHEWSDSYVDVYTRDRMQWVSDMCLSGTFANAENEAEDMGCETTDMTERAGVLQYCAIRNIASIILQAYQSAKEALDESCAHEDIYCNDRSQTVCRDCGEELGR